MNHTELEKMRNFPLHKYLGVRSIKAEKGTSVVRVEVTENNLNPKGSFHGGILYGLCDVAAFSALLSAIDEGQHGVTNTINVQAMRPAQLGDILEFRGKVLKIGRRLSFIETEVYKADKIIAKATVTKSMV